MMMIQKYKAEFVEKKQKIIGYTRTVTCELELKKFGIIDLHSVVLCLFVYSGCKICLYLHFFLGTYCELFSFHLSLVYKFYT